MTGARRGFGRERHTALKAVLAAVAVAGFLAAWAGLARAHPASSESGSPRREFAAPRCDQFGGDDAAHAQLLANGAARRFRHTGGSADCGGGGAA